MAFTKTFAATVAQQDIVAGSYTNRITIREDASGGGGDTTDYIVRRPNSSNSPVQIASGTPFEISGNFHPDQPLGTICLPAGTADTVFQQIED